MTLSRISLCLAMAIGPNICAAQSSDPPPFPEFTFRTVQPPQAGQTGPRINIQIEPVVAEPVAAIPDSAPLAPDDGPSGWFWSAVPSAMDAPGRMQMALSHLATAPEARDLPVARLEELREIAEAHGVEILTATAGQPVSPALVLAVMAVESRGRNEAQSGAGAQGLMQLIPATAERFGVQDVFDPAQNIRGGVAYLNWLLDEFGNDPVLALAGYNAGEGAVRGAGGVPDYAETRDYIPKVLATWDLARMLCLTPPEFVQDGCVFATMTGG